ncbi:energy transducer TonB [Vibrio scophthalmi]|uniref:energy transducer TonB n=1 Tax=Vibrio scophthalmi TaxID=45658 RepID=UPI002FF2D3C6
MLKRWLIATPLALLVTLSLFAFMAWLVDAGKSPMPEPQSALRFDVVQVENERAAARRARQLPEPPKAPTLAPQVERLTTQMAAQQIQTTALPNLPNVNLSTSVTGMAMATPGPIQLAQNQQLMPLHRIEPRYPSRALKRKIEGYVVMRFAIDETGRPDAIEVVEGSPRGVFDREAMRALRQWKYQPLIVAGKATRQEGQTVKLEFRLQ